MNRLKFLGLCIVSSSLIYFSYSLLLVTKEIKHVREELPDLVQQIQAMEHSIDVPAWIRLLESIHSKIPPILKEVSEVRQTMSTINEDIPNILLEVKALREVTIPNILDESAKIRKDIVPSTIAEIKAIRQGMIPAVLEEVKAVRESTVPAVLNELAAVREITPKTLARVENIVNKAKKTVEEASEGAVQGTVKGILKTPLTIIKGVVDQPKKLLRNEK